MAEKILVYGKKGCSRCTMVKTILDKKEISYDYFDLESLSENEQESIKSLAKKSKDTMVMPIILKDGVSMFVSEL